VQVRSGAAAGDAWLSKAIKSLPGLDFLPADNVPSAVQQLLCTVLHLPRGTTAASPSMPCASAESNPLPPSQHDCPSAKPRSGPENPDHKLAVQLLTQLLSHPAPAVARAAYAAVDGIVQSCVDACREDRTAGGASNQVSHQHVIDPKAHAASQVSHQYITDPGLQASGNGDRTDDSQTISPYHLRLLCTPSVIREIITHGLAGDNAHAAARILAGGAKAVGSEFRDKVGCWQVLNPRPGRRQT
jgi:hypothetical protein